MMNKLISYIVWRRDCSMRKKIVAGNWKMNMTPKEAVSLVCELRDKFSNRDVDEEKGAYTGEISPGMLKEAGVDYVIVGHSERRQYFGEDDECINRKVRKAIEYGLTPIICCGETIQQREEGITLDFINKQIDAAFLQVSAKDAMKCVIAYEPIWAIGTGRVATSAQAQEVCEAIRLDIRKLYGEEAASSIRILYGGSVNAGNAAELFRQPDIDGGLVGGASLKPDFCEIVNYNI